MAEFGSPEFDNLVESFRQAKTADAQRSSTNQAQAKSAEQEAAVATVRLTRISEQVAKVALGKRSPNFSLFREIPLSGFRARITGTYARIDRTPIHTWQLAPAIDSWGQSSEFQSGSSGLALSPDGEIYTYGYYDDGHGTSGKLSACLDNAAAFRADHNITGFNVGYHGYDNTVLNVQACEYYLAKFAAGLQQ
jgi:hypothetical protein